MLPNPMVPFYFNCLLLIPLTGRVPVPGLWEWLNTTFRSGEIGSSLLAASIHSLEEEDAACPLSPHGGCAREHSDKQGQWEAGFVVSRGWGTSCSHRRMWLACWRTSDIVHTNDGDCVHAAFLTLLSTNPGFVLHSLVMSSRNPFRVFES